MFIPSRLKEIRIQEGVTQNMVASRLGISREAYSQYENGRRKPSLDTLCSICRTLSASADFLLGQSPANLLFASASPQERFILTHLRDLGREGLDLIMLVLQTLLERDLT